VLGGRRRNGVIGALDTLIPEPRLREVDRVDLAAPVDVAWRLARGVDLAQSPLAQVLFAIRTIPERLRCRATRASMRIDDLAGDEGPGFRLLGESEGEVVVGAIGKVWRLDIPFVDVHGAEEFQQFKEPGFAKVAWALRARSTGESRSRIEVEVRVSTTDDDSWRKFRRYFRFIGPASRWIRRSTLAALARELRRRGEAFGRERTAPVS
jgi:hypothetical protein